MSRGSPASGSDTRRAPDQARRRMAGVPGLRRVDRRVVRLAPVAGLILVPVARGSWPFSTLAIDQSREVALPLLIGHIVYGGVLGLAWSNIARWTAVIGQRPDATHVTGRRAA